MVLDERVAVPAGTGDLKCIEETFWRQVPRPVDLQPGSESHLEPEQTLSRASGRDTFLLAES